MKELVLGLVIVLTLASIHSQKSDRESANFASIDKKTSTSKNIN